MKKHIKKHIMASILCVFLLSFFMLENIGADNTNKKIVRIGFIEYGDFIYWNEDRKEYDGYGVGYLNEVVNDLEWQIEYVGGNWEECLQMLRDGSIDILCPAQKNEEREDEFLFSAYPVGITETIVYVAKSEDSLFYEDYDYLQNKRIGMICASAQQSSFREFARNNGIQYTEVPFDSSAEMLKAVEENKIDIFVTSSLSVFPDYQVIASFNVAPFYFMLNQDHAELLEELNEAVGNLKIKVNDFDTKLYDEYIGVNQYSKKPLFTREEYEFIQNSPEITIGMLQNFFPYSDYKDEQMQGICEELLMEISRISGLSFRIVPIEEGCKPRDELLENNGIDLIGGMMRSKDFLEDHELQVSDAFLEFEYVAIAVKENEINSLEELTIAIPQGFPYMQQYLEINYPKSTLVILEDNEDCLDAVEDGKADVTVQNEYVCAYSLQNPKYNNLSLVKNISIDGTVCFVANDSVNPLVISILNKTVKCISTSNRNKIINEFTIANSYKASLWEMIYGYRKYLIFYGIVAGLVFIIIYYISREKTRAVQEKKEAELIKNQIEISRLTGLYNKHAFYQNAENLIRSNPDKRYEIIVFDIEKFKIINDLFGMEVGDNLLKYFADRLRQVVEGKGIAGYRGADNFVICVEDTCFEDIDSMEKEIHDYVNEFQIDIKVQICIGIYQVINSDVPVSLMCDRANMAAASIKGNELRHYAYYDDSMRQKLINDQIILNEMQEALEQGQFQVYIQPKCRVDNEELIGGEALVRWIHPEKGLISPGEFIPLFEKNGFITKLDYHVWEETCKLIRKWKDEGIKTVPLSVNISRLNFYLPGFETVFEKLLQKYNLTPDDLYLEVTESAYTNESNIIFNQLSQLQEKKFTILMDDFGSGYSSLNMLQEAPVDVLKLDMKFLLGKDEKKRSEIILESVIKMAKQLGFRIIAEGVESREQCEMLLRLGCHFGQGYYFSRPISAEQFEQKYLNEKKAS